MTDTLTVTGYTSGGGQRRFTEAKFDISRWPAHSAIRHGLMVFAERAKLIIPSASKIYSIKSALSDMEEQSKSIFSADLNSFDRDTARTALEILDLEFRNNKKLSAFAANARYLAICELLCSLQGQMHDGSTFEQVAAAYSLDRRKGRRGDPSKQNPLPQEIAEISHIDLSELRDRTHRALLARKSAIELAATQMIETYEAVVIEQERLLSIPVCPELTQTIEAWLEEMPSGTKRAKCAPEQFASILLRRLNERPPKLVSGWPVGLRAARDGFADLPEFLNYRFKVSTWPWFYARHRLPNFVLTTIFILLLAHTGWNSASVGSLTTDTVEKLPNGSYRLQGHKNKTDDDTPMVDVPRSMKTLCKAIDLLLWNYNQLVAAKCIDPVNEKRLWFGWQKDNFETTSNFVAEQRLAAWFKRTGVVPFTPSELRPLAAGLAYLPQRDLEAVRVLLGHSDLNTTDHYLENTLFFRLNEAMMLEFQRRIETSIAYSQGGETLIKSRRLNLSHLDARLLVPTGDGGACTDIMAGPTHRTHRTSEPCPGIACQTGAGCKHYRLTVNSITLEMALRTRLYYRSRWQSLWDSNPTAFSKLHLPRLLYIYVLLRIVFEQRPDIYQRAEAAIG
ncbi:Tyrosine recombinase XerC [Burkholderia sp. AD24]|nr:Tyrosine recombinase XerC [Burkholderia sp. AD24]